MKHYAKLLAGVVLALASLHTQAEEPKVQEAAVEPVFMSAQWAEQACAAWNQDPVLTDKLKESGWVENHKDKDYKVMQIYREDCPNSPHVEMQIADKDGKALCVYGGVAKTAKLHLKADYQMWAKDKHWLRMGDGTDGPMKAMMLGRLNFEGPSFEAMSNMGPFSSFLRLTGKVPANRSSCP